MDLPEQHQVQLQKNPPPTTKDDSYGVIKNNTINIDRFGGILANDYDGNLDEYNIIVDGVELTTNTQSHIFKTANNGDVTLYGDGHLSYTPRSNYTGADTFTYTLIDNDGESAPATVTLTVTEVNYPPTDIDINTTQVLSNQIDGTKVATFTTTDPNTNDVFDYILLNNASGRFGVQGDKLTIANSANIVMGQTYTIRVRSTDLQGEYIEKDFSIFIPPSPTQTTNTGITLDEGATATITRSELEFDDDSSLDSQITYTLLSIPANGILKLNSTELGINDTFTQSDINNSLVTYEHNGSETTSDSFDFNVTDKDGLTTSGNSFSIIITPVNDIPTASDVNLSAINEDTNKTFVADDFNYSDVDIGALLNSIFVTSLTSNGELLYNGTAINVDGEDNSTSSYSATLNITSVNDAPNITIGNSITVDEDNTGTLTFTFTDVDGDTVTATQKSVPSKGSITISGTTITYTPNENLYGSDSFTLTLTDGNGYSVDKTINVTINSVNDQQF